MDGWATTVGLTTLAFIYFGERFRAGVYLWVGMLFAIIFALRMAEPMFYMATAGLIGVLLFRIFYGNQDVREGDIRDDRE